MIFRVFVIIFLLYGFSDIALLRNIPISVVAPASGIDSKSLSDLKKIAYLNLKIPDKCFKGAKQVFFSNSDEVRLRCVKDALFDQSDNIVWALRGGYGSAKLIPALQQLVKPTKEKFFIGFSDITALHIFLSQEWGWKTIHGNGIAEILKLDKDPKNFIKIAEIISGKVKQVEVNGLSALNSAAMSDKIISGKLTGGNLTMLQTSIGTSWQVKTAHKILFLEDVNITPYQIDRALLHLQQANLLKDIKAIIFGSFGRDDQAIMAELNNFASSISIPVFKTNRFGHEKINDPIIYNTESKITSTGNRNFKLIMQI